MYKKPPPYIEQPDCTMPVNPFDPPAFVRPQCPVCFEGKLIIETPPQNHLRKVICDWCDLDHTYEMIDGRAVRVGGEHYARQIGRQYRLKPQKQKPRKLGRAVAVVFLMLSFWSCPALGQAPSVEPLMTQGRVNEMLNDIDQNAKQLVKDIDGVRSYFFESGQKLPHRLMVAAQKSASVVNTLVDLAKMHQATSDIAAPGQAATDLPAVDITLAVGDSISQAILSLNGGGTIRLLPGHHTLKDVPGNWDLRNVGQVTIYGDGVASIGLVERGTFAIQTPRPIRWVGVDFYLDTIRDFHRSGVIENCQIYDPRGMIANMSDTQSSSRLFNPGSHFKLTRVHLHDSFNGFSYTEIYDCKVSRVAHDVAYMCPVVRGLVVRDVDGRTSGAHSDIFQTLNRLHVNIDGIYVAKSCVDMQWLFGQDHGEGTISGTIRNINSRIKLTDPQGKAPVVHFQGGKDLLVEDCDFGEMIFSFRGNFINVTFRNIRGRNGLLTQADVPHGITVIND